MNIEIKDELAKELIDSYALSIKSEVDELKLKMHLRSKLQDFQNDKSSALTNNIDAMFEVFSKFPYRGVSVSEFCMGVVYKGRLGDSKYHVDEIKSIGEARLVKLYEAVEELQKKLDIEYVEMYKDTEYLELLEARKCFKKPSNSKKLIESEIYKKEMNYIANYNKKKDLLNTLSIACEGRKHSQMAIADKKHFIKRIAQLVDNIKESNKTSNM